MTNEQVAIYLYGIYPNGGITVLSSVIVGILLLIFLGSYADKELNSHKELNLANKLFYQTFPLKKY